MTTPPPDRPANELAGVVRKVDAEFHEHGKTLSGVADLIGRLETHIMLTLGTCHLPSGQFLETLNEWEGLHVVYHDNGAFMWVPDDPQDSADALQGECVPEAHDPGCDDCSVHGHGPSVPPLILDIQKFARTIAGADWVNFDSDGPEILDLPTWKW